MSEQTRDINLDIPLSPDNALQEDELGRGSFAKQVADTLYSVRREAGVTVSIEGKWGSGKTSTISLVQETISKKDSNTLVVHFNPWFISDQQSLLSVLLEQLAESIGNSNNNSAARKAAKELRTYSHLFNLVKFVPGAEPYASVAEKIFKGTGAALNEIAELKAPSITGKKRELEKALKEIKTPIVVFIDDIDTTVSERNL